MTLFRTILFAVLFVTASYSPSQAFHVCPTLSDTAPVVPQVGSDGTKARHATELIRRKMAQNKHLPPGQLKKLLQQDLQDRAPDVRWLCRENPDSCGDALLTEAEQNLIGLDGCLEQNVIIEGTYGAIIARTDTGAVTQSVLQTTDGRQLRMSAAANHRSMLQGKGHVVVRGVQLGAADLFIPQDGGVVQDVTPTSTGFQNPPAYVRGPVRILLVAASFTDSPSTETQAQLQADATMIQDYYRQTSDGQSVPTVTVFPRTVSVPVATTCSPGNDHTALVNVLDSEVDFRQYDIFGIASSYTVCGWGGVAFLGPIELRGTMDGVIQMGTFLARENQAHIDLHEIGHTYNLHHGAGFTVPSWFPVGDSGAAGASWVEYAHPLNTLGRSNSRGPFGVLHRYALGWLAPPDLLVNPLPGTYRLLPVGSPRGSGTPQGLLIRRGLSDYLAVELRRSINAWESYVPTGAVKRFGCYVLSSHHTPWPHEGAHQLTPRTYQGCEVGDVIDDVTGTRVTIVAVTDTDLTVRVDVVGPADLTLPATRLTAPTMDQGVVGSVAVTATLDDVRPFGVQFQLVCGGSSSYTARVTTTPYTATLDTTRCPDGPAWIYATGSDAVGQFQTSAVRIQSNNGGSVSTTTTTTSTSTTTTTNPDALTAIVDSDTPDPSPWGIDVRVCAHGMQRGAVVPIASVYVADGPTCQGVGTDAARLCCDVALSGSTILHVYVRSALLGWSEFTTEPHAYGGTTTTTSGPSTTTTSTSRTPTTTTSSTLASSTTTTTTLRPTTLAPTSSTTSTLRPTTSTTLGGCLSYQVCTTPVGRGARCEGRVCAAGLTCMKAGGQWKCN